MCWPSKPPSSLTPPHTKAHQPIHPNRYLSHGKGERKNNKNHRLFIIWWVIESVVDVTFDQLLSLVLVILGSWVIYYYCCYYQFSKSRRTWSFCVDPSNVFIPVIPLLWPFASHLCSLVGERHQSRSRPGRSNEFPPIFPTRSPSIYILRWFCHSHKYMYAYI